MTDRNVTLRLAVADAERAIRDLRSFGDQGEDALKRLQGASQPASRGLQAVNTAAVATGRSLAVMQSAVLALAGGLAVSLGPVALFSSALGAGIRNAEAAEQSFLRLEGVIRATGGAAGLTAGEISTLAEELERTTLASSEAVTDAAAVLATFRSVSGEVFTDTLRLAQDLAAVFGGDLRSQATQLGKALEDPIQGLTALRRVGVSFTQEQRDVIRALVETNEAAQAQRVILDELERQVGGAGAAEADGLTGAMSRARAALGDLLQVMTETSGVADGLTGAFERWAGVLDRAAGGLRENIGREVVAIGRQIFELEQQLAGIPDGPLANFQRGNISERIADLRAEEQALLDRGQAENQAIIAARERGRLAAEQADADRRAATDAAAAAKAAEAAERERERAANAAAVAAQRRADLVRKALGDLALEVEQQQRLREALADSEAAHREVAKAIEVENELRAVGLDLTSDQGRELARLVSLRQQEAVALERLQNAQRFLAEQESERIRRLEDRGFDPAVQARDMAARAAEAERAVQRERDAAVARQVAALETAVDRITGTVASTVRDFRLGLIDGAEDFAARIADALSSIPEQLAATAFTSLFDGIIADFGEALKGAVGPGGELDFTALFGAFGNPLGAAALGAFGGSMAANVLGIGGPFSGLGGGLGAGLGFAVGGPVGGLLGGIGGTLLGGLFGGGSQRDNVGTRIDLATLAVDAGGTPNQNTARAQALGAQVAGLITGLRAAGVDFDASGQIRFNVNNTRSDADVFRGATRQVLERSTATDPILAQVLASTRAQSPDALLADVQFGRLFEQLTEAITPAEAALRDLNIQFDEAARRAAQLGLDEAALTAARQRATEDLVRATEDQVRSAADSIASIFSSRIGPLQGALDGFSFGPGSALGVEAQLGLARSEFDLLTGRARAGEDIDFSRLASLGTQVVGLARELDASGSIFQSTFADVDSTLRDLIAEQTAQQDSLLVAFNALELGQRDQTAILAERLDRVIAEFAALTRTVELQGRVA